MAGPAEPQDWPPPDLEGRLTLLQQRMAAAGYPVRVVSKQRSAQQQRDLYAQGRTRPGARVTELSGEPGQESRHQQGQAADFAFTTKGREDWKLLGAEAKKLGLEWGGDWTSLKDQPHVQMPKHTPFPRGGQAPGGSTDPASVRVTNAQVGQPPPRPAAPIGPGQATAAPVEDAVEMPTPPPAPAVRMASPLGAIAPPAPVGGPPPGPAPAPSVPAATASAAAAAPVAAMDFVDEPRSAVAATPAAPVASASSPAAPVSPVTAGADFVDEPIGTAAPAAMVARAGQPANQGGPPPSGEEGIATPPPAPSKSLLQRAGDLGVSVLSSFDPRKKEGRRNIAGGVGAALGGALAPVTGGASLLIPVAAAGGAGALEEAGEQLIGGPPPGGFSGRNVALAGGEQALYEVGGRALLWPVRAVGRRLIASRVGRAAAETLSTQRQALVGQLSGALDAARQLLRGTRIGAGQAVEAAEAGTKASVAAAKQTGKAGVERAAAAGEAGVAQAEGTAAQGAAAATQPYEQLIGAPPPSPSAVGRSVNHVIQEGGAARARDLLGQAVERAAESGPAVDISALKQEAERIIETELKPPAETFPRSVAEPPPDANAMIGGGATPSEAIDAVAAAQAEAGKERLKHPAMGVLSRILNAADQVPFKDAHLFKKELDEAIGNTWDRSVRKKLTNLTKVFRGQLRGALAVHEPYNAATAAYGQIAPLFGSGIAPKLRKLAVEAPEAIIRLVSPSKPTNLLMLKDLLLHQAAEGGDAAGGQAAWDSLASAWTHERVVKGGIDGLGKRLQAIEAQTPFFQGLYGDGAGQAVWTNLKMIDSAYRAALAHGEAGVASAKIAGEAGVSAAKAIGERAVTGARDVGERAVGALRQQGTQQVERAQQGVTAAQTARKTGLAPLQAEERKLATSTLAPRSSSPGQTTGDILRAIAYGPYRALGAISVGRLMSGPTANDLIYWAALSPQSTQKLVWALTSQAPATAVAELARASGILGESTNRVMTKGKPQPAEQPAARENVGTPPPAPSGLVSSR